MFCKTVADVDNGFGDRTPACREYTHPREDKHFRIYVAIPERTVIGPGIQVHIRQFLGTHGIEIQVPSTTTPCRGKNRLVYELHFRDPGHKITFGTIYAKESEPCSTELEHSRIEETHATQSNNPPNPVYETILVGERRWKNILACESYKGDSLSAQTPKLVMRLVRRYDQDERETKALFIGIPWARKAFQKFGGRNLSDMDWLHYSYQGSNKMRF